MSTHIIAGLKSLKLHGMAANYPDVAAQARHTDFTPDSFMHQLILSESADIELFIIHDIFKPLPTSPLQGGAGGGLDILKKFYTQIVIYFAILNK